MEDPIIVEIREKIAVVTLNRPEAYNALNPDLLTRLARALEDLDRDSGVQGVIITGKGKAFSGGGDLKWARSHAGGLGKALDILVERFNQVVLEIRVTGKPVAAAVNGTAAGGGFSLALACDFRVMTRSAFMKQAYTSSGLSIDGGGTFMLPRLVGMSRAMEIAALDELIGGERALAWGLVNRLADDGEALNEAFRMMRQVVQGSLHSFGCSKELFNAAYHHTFETQIELERRKLVECGEHPDGAEGVSAFVEKRKPLFNP